MKIRILAFALLSTFFCVAAAAADADDKNEKASETLNLITDTPEEGFQLALRLARKGVTETQPDREVLFKLREAYATDPDSLIAASHVVAVHFQTIAAANDYWRDR